jgi:hypothetical protein
MRVGAATTLSRRIQNHIQQRTTKGIYTDNTVKFLARQLVSIIHNSKQEFPCQKQPKANGTLNSHFL